PETHLSYSVWPGMSNPWTLPPRAGCGTLGGRLARGSRAAELPMILARSTRGALFILLLGLLLGGCDEGEVGPDAGLSDGGRCGAEDDPDGDTISSRDEGDGDEDGD